MKKVFFALGLLILAGGCSTQKHVMRQSADSSYQSESRDVLATRLKREVAKEASVSKDSHITETCDTSLVVPGATVAAEQSLAAFLASGSFAIDSKEVKGTIRIDTLTGKVNMTVERKPQVYASKFQRTTDTREITNSTSNEKEDARVSAAREQTSMKEIKTSSVIKDVERSVPWWAFGLVIVCVCLIVLVVRFALKFYCTK